MLFKLGRSYLNRNESRRDEAREAPASKQEEEIETISVEEVTIEDVIVDDVTDEDLQSWTKNKLRGFKRAGPESRAEKKTENNATPKSSSTTGTKNGPSGKPSTTGMVASSETSPNQSNEADERRSGKTLYCHFYSNLGKCVFEERTGAKCKFEHKEAPMCPFGTSCGRNKCMYKHPNMAGRRNMNPNFLEQNSGYNHQMNPWPMMNPWLALNPNMYSNPAL